MFEILMYLFQNYFDSGEYPESDNLTRKLTAAGFEDDDISDALSWLSALQPVSAHNHVEIIHSGVRHFAPLELEFLSSEALCFLVFIERQHLISITEREMIMDKAVCLKQKNLGLDKLKLVILMVLWSCNKNLDALLIEELLSPLQSKQLH